ncbi:MAG: hypothetical protein OEP95_08940 [Myxococcales bacterium]|nr:hypothetical protein [Myxococcales bacterium]
MTEPTSVAEALERARQHGRAAAAEATAAVRALLDAAALGATGTTGSDIPALQSVRGSLDDLHRWLEGGQASTTVVVALAEALETEIRRWETRGAEDEEARAVLRAFLGLRELLWELGVRAPAGAPAAAEAPRGPAAEAPEAAAPEPAPKPRRASRSAQIHRIPVEG